MPSHGSAARHAAATTSSPPPSLPPASAPATCGPTLRSPSYAALRTSSLSLVRIVLRSCTEEALVKVPCEGRVGGQEAVHEKKDS